MRSTSSRIRSTGNLCSSRSGAEAPLSCERGLDAVLPAQSAEVRRREAQSRSRIRVLMVEPGSAPQLPEFDTGFPKDVIIFLHALDGKPLPGE